MRDQLVQWQSDGFPTYHMRPVTLWVHLVAVPAFVLASVGAVVGLATLQPVALAVSVLTMASSLGVQGLTHAREINPVIPFNGVVDALSRILLEQYFTFPQFVLNGGWWRALRRS